MSQLLEDMEQVHRQSLAGTLAVPTVQFTCDMMPKNTGYRVDRILLIGAALCQLQQAPKGANPRAPSTEALWWTKLPTCEPIVPTLHAALQLADARFGVMVDTYGAVAKWQATLEQAAAAVHQFPVHPDLRGPVRWEARSISPLLTGAARTEEEGTGSGSGGSAEEGGAGSAAEEEGAVSAAGATRQASVTVGTARPGGARGGNQRVPIAALADDTMEGSDGASDSSVQVVMRGAPVQPAPYATGRAYDGGDEADGMLEATCAVLLADLPAPEEIAVPLATSLAALTPSMLLQGAANRTIEATALRAMLLPLELLLYCAHLPWQVLLATLPPTRPMWVPRTSLLSRQWLLGVAMARVSMLDAAAPVLGVAQDIIADAASLHQVYEYAARTLPVDVEVQALMEHATAELQNPDSEASRALAVTAQPVADILQWVVDLKAPLPATEDTALLYGALVVWLLVGQAASGTMARTPSPS